MAMLSFQVNQDEDRGSGNCVLFVIKKSRSCCSKSTTTMPPPVFPIRRGQLSPPPGHIKSRPPKFAKLDYTGQWPVCVQVRLGGGGLIANLFSPLRVSLTYFLRKFFFGQKAQTHAGLSNVINLFSLLRNGDSSLHNAYGTDISMYLSIAIDFCYLIKLMRFKVFLLPMHRWQCSVVGISKSSML